MNRTDVPCPKETNRCGGNERRARMNPKKKIIFEIRAIRLKCKKMAKKGSCEGKKEEG